MWPQGLGNPYAPVVVKPIPGARRAVLPPVKPTADTLIVIIAGATPLQAAELDKNEKVR